MHSYPLSRYQKEPVFLVYAILFIKSFQFIIILPYKLNIYIKLKKKKDEAREPKEANKAYL